MELRVLQYFLAVAREQSISGAADSLHLSQPTLSRQIRDLEEELGKQLIIRGNRKITLTEDGIVLRKRAEEILELVQKTENEITVSSDTVAGDIYIGTGESEGVRLIVKAGKELQKQYPAIHIHMISGDSYDLIEHLDKGLFDFAILCEPADLSAYESLCLPHQDALSVLMPADCALASKKEITLDDLDGLPLIASRQQANNHLFESCIKQCSLHLNIVATYNLIFNASLMVQEGMGYAIGFDHIIDTSDKSNLVCKPLSPRSELSMHLVWKKYQIFTKASQLYLEKIQELISSIS